MTVCSVCHRVASLAPHDSRCMGCLLHSVRMGAGRFWRESYEQERDQQLAREREASLRLTEAWRVRRQGVALVVVGLVLCAAGLVGVAR